MEIQLLRGGADRNNSDDSVKTALEEGVTSANVDKLMIAVPGKNFSILATEVTQELYKSVMGENPSSFKGEKNLPVETVSWYDAVYFCNKLSKICGLTPVYDVDGETDVEKWSYVPNKGNEITKTVSQNENANGYRLPTVAEWQWAAKGGQEFTYSGSGNLDEVGWYNGNSEEKTHPVAQKDPNGYGLYDMSGNVWEWCWDSDSGDGRYDCGGWLNYAGLCGVVGYEIWDLAGYRSGRLGFRIVRSTGK
ncbi:formylglycine-generating enzyme family protein [uncultured Treponema sp.]|uniref:formylglycine-generating enzyme family protein n=1 Tax=uncultured Treponema sp. TaxID=162155 RepID=UPI0025FB2C02|nr:formylglycine-generating enzyme family protein [uncultured Treponema sp.]